MKAKELKSLRERYVELRERLIATLQESEFEVDIAGDAVDKLQGASLLRVQNMLSKQNIYKLNAIDNAIGKIDMGDYGDCEECGEPIGFKRLELIPGVSLCVCCAEIAERHR
jgi:DnaK suppressor protein